MVVELVELVAQAATGEHQEILATQDLPEQLDQEEIVLAVAAEVAEVAVPVADLPEIQLRVGTE
jgi:hypothetical protein